MPSVFTNSLAFSPLKPRHPSAGGSQVVQDLVQIEGAAWCGLWEGEGMEAEFLKLSASNNSSERTAHSARF
jgi:hypothetical protein